MKINNIEIGNSKIFVIAEIGNNHNGSLKLALEEKLESLSYKPVYSEE